MTRTSDPRRQGVTGEVGGSNDTPQGRAMQLVSLSHTLCDEGRPAEAEDLCRWVLSQAPNLPSAQVAFGRARLEQGHVQEARAILEGAAAKHPAFFAAQRWLAEVLVRMGDWPRASEVLVKAEALSPGQPRIAELVRQVMGVGPGGPPPAGPPQAAQAAPATVPPPVASPAISAATSGVRRRTYMGPAVADPVPPPPTATVALPAAPAPIRPANSLGSSQQSEPPRAPAAHGNTPTRRQPYPTPPPPARERVVHTGGVSQRLYAWRQLGGVWMRQHPRAALLSAGVLLFTAAALLVVLVSWAVRPRGEGSTLADWVLPAGGVAVGPAALPPVRAGAFDELAALLRADRRLRAGGDAAGRPFLALGLMATEYGRPVSGEVEQVADELAGRVTEGAARLELDAGRVLLRVARGDGGEAAKLASAARLAPAGTPLTRFVEARRRVRGGDGAGALAALGEGAERSPFLPGRLLLAELRLDRGETGAALAVLRGVLAESPSHPIALQLLIEASHQLDGPMAAADAQLVDAECRRNGERITALAAACRLHRGVEARRAGRRADALAAAREAADVVPAQPRLMAATALLLVNTGATEHALHLVREAARLADPRLPLLAWARAGVALATDRRVALPPGPPPGSEARLIAARASFVGTREGPLSSALLPAGDGRDSEDGDLRWVSDGARVKGAVAARALASRVEARYGPRPPGPVAAFVAGTLARRGGKHPLARTWLSRSLDGHGDACRAASLYRIALKAEGKDPLLNARLQRAIGRLGCDRLK
jgi:tetratricopeptide (TPR) repeat protein